MKALSTFLILSLTAAVASASKIDLPPQGIARWTHYPTWRVPTPDWDTQQLDSVIVFSMVGVFLAVLVAMHYEILVKKPNIRTIRDTYHANSRLFSTIISYYLIATLVSVVGFFLLDLGKLWGMLGALHNLMEVSILMVMTFSRYPAYFKHFYLIIFLYFLATEWLTLVLPWPYDAVFFKFQGLASDFALCVNFSRLYLANKRNPIQLPDEDHPGASSTIEEIEVDEDSHLVNNSTNSFETPRRNLLASILPNGRGSHSHSHDHSNGHSNGHSNDHSNGHSNGYSNPNPNVDDDPLPTTADAVRLLVLAATLHTLGNTITTLWDGFMPFLLFQFLYGVAYPIYAYYVAQVHNDHQIRWFDVSIVTETIVAIVSIVFSAVVVGISSFLLLKKYEKHDLIEVGY